MTRGVRIRNVDVDETFRARNVEACRVEVELIRAIWEAIARAEVGQRGLVDLSIPKSRGYSDCEVYYGGKSRRDSEISEMSEESCRDSMRHRSLVIKASLRPTKLQFSDLQGTTWRSNRVCSGLS